METPIKLQEIGYVKKHLWQRDLNIKPVLTKRLHSRARVYVCVIASGVTQAESKKQDVEYCGTTTKMNSKTWTGILM